MRFTPSLFLFFRHGPDGPGARRGPDADPSNLEEALLQVLPAARQERKRGSRVSFPGRKRNGCFVGKSLENQTWLCVRAGDFDDSGIFRNAI